MSEDMIKQRQKVQTVELGSDWSTFSGSVSGLTNYGLSTFRSSDKLLLNQGHKGPPFKEGGPFQTSTVDIQLFPCPMNEDFLYNQTFNWRFLAKGNFVPNIGQGLSSVFTGLSANFSRTLAMGTDGYNRYKPGSSDNNIGQFLGELKEIPTIPKTLRHVFYNFKSRKNFLMKDFRRHVAGDYLNVQFGWVPFLADLRKVVMTSYKKSKIISQLARDNGRPIRRRGPISSSSSTVETVTTGSGYPPALLPPINSLHFTGNWKKTVTTEISEEYWFSARFRYYIPDFGSLEWSKRFVAALYGVNPSPELIYNLIPWTWAIDWFTNIGSTMSNFSPSMAENLVADYAYVMEHRRIRTTTVIEFNTRSGPKSCSAIVTQESKYRLPASPFGFGVTWDGFSPKQLAIMMALGFSRR
jgi:hypothetical protein